ncbi:MAG: hypothetical protein AMJ92_00040 [candidate division Zixibacteria bacterium SM23_81]|nr:MAG: hypothetical protein AMJ92_00040 [candidate division Zixibacteria bacterium SM23_81]
MLGTGFVPMERKHLDCVKPLNRKPGKDVCQPPCPWGLWQVAHYWADCRAGLFIATIPDMAREFGCGTSSLKRSLQPLFQHRCLIRLFPKKCLIFINEFPIIRNKKLYHLRLKRNIDGSYSIYVADENGSYMDRVLTVHRSYRIRRNRKTDHICTIFPKQIFKHKRLGYPLNTYVINKENVNKEPDHDLSTDDSFSRSRKQETIGPGRKAFRKVLDDLERKIEVSVDD